MQTEESTKEDLKMAFQIDLNEAPLPSPRELPPNDVVLAGVLICSVCRKGVRVGKQAEVATEQQRKEFKCLHCLLKNGGNAGGGSGTRRFDINSSPPKFGDGDDTVVVIGERRGIGGGSKKEASTHFPFPGYRATRRQQKPCRENSGYNLPKTSLVATGFESSGFQGMSQQMHFDGNFQTLHKGSPFDGRFQPNHPPPLKYAPGTPNMVYLDTLREYIAQRNGFLGEGWNVDFEFCEKRLKTSAVYTAPDGNRLNSTEDVARHIGLISSHHHIEKGNGKNTFAFIQNGLSTTLTAQNCRQRQLTLSRCKKEFVISGCGSNGDDIHGGFPIQFQDFCLISAGHVDPRPSYYNTSQIWPVGYKCTWHDRITGSLFVCDVADGGDNGPIFKVQRYPCTMHSIPVGSTNLSRATVKGDGKLGKDDSPTFQAVEDYLSIITLFNEDSPPCLDNCFSTPKKEDGIHKSQEVILSNSDTGSLPQTAGNSTGVVVGLNDIIGEFQVECRSTLSVWEKVAHVLVNACYETFKHKGVIKFFCGHDIYGINNENMDHVDSLLRYCYFGGPTIPPLVQDENVFNMTCETLSTWLKQDRFGLDADFVQEIIEKLPGITACLEYKNLNDRKNSACLQTVGNGFFLVECKASNSLETSKRSQLQSGDGKDILNRDPCPPGKSISSRLPLYLMGDVLQVWELGWRFLDVLGLGEPFTFQELESELVSPWLGSYPNEKKVIGDSVLCRGENDDSTGILMTKIIGQLLKLLVGELLSKVAVYACPNFDAGESKSRRGKRKDFDCFAALKKTKLERLPINELTLNEVARRYILAVLSMEGNLDSTEITSRESRKVFHCLQGDGGILFGSLTGIAALEADAVVLADAMKKIFGSSKSKVEIVSICEGQSDSDGAQTIEVNDDAIPEWAQVLEPVRKLPTNVGARIRRCINEALEKNPPEWAKKMLEHSISKEVYKGNASGPTKRAVISVLANVSSENPPLKAEKKEKVKIKTNLTDLISKQCRIVLRRAAAADEDRVFCNLLGKTDLYPNDSDGEGLIGCPATVSRPLDFRTIDLRLAAGVYDGSHEAFSDDVREVWGNIRIVYGDRADLVVVAENLFQKFEDLYEKEVLTLVRQFAESSDNNEERENLVVHITKSPLPKAPWEDGICKVCGMDRDDDNVLLCDKCDSEYHRYCLNPPLVKIPEGNWYCPSCVSGQSFLSIAAYRLFDSRYRKRKYQGEFTRTFLESLGRFADLLERKDCSELKVEEKIFFMKFLFDEALNSGTIHDHIEQCTSRAADLQQKQRSITSELKLLKFKEEMLGLGVEKPNSGVCNAHGDLQSDASSSQPSCPPSRSNNSTNELPIIVEQQQNDQMHPSVPRDSPVNSIHESQDNSLKLLTIKNDISELQKSISSIELELVKISLRKDLLGRDSSGRVYWAFYSPGARPWIIANGNSISKERGSEEFITIPDSDKWMSYESDKEIEELFKWLKENNVREKELKESILHFQLNKLKDSDCTEKHVLSREGLNLPVSSNGRKDLLDDFLATKAIASLEKKFGPCLGTKTANVVQNLASGERQDGKMYRCECLEILWSFKEHCSSCHQSFPNDEQVKQHSADCKPVASISMKPSEESFNHKKSKIATSQEKNYGASDALQISINEKQTDACCLANRYLEPDCPFKHEEIMSRFIVPNSFKDEANSIGLLGSGGVPAFLPGSSPYFNDPALTQGITRKYEVNLAEAMDLRSKKLKTNNEAGLVKEANRSHEERPNVEKTKSILINKKDHVSSVKDRSSVIRVSINSIISKSSSRPLVGRSAEILRSLKIHLLDMDAALPEDALRLSRSHQNRRFAWRAFVKSATTIYEMVLATIVLEDTIKSEYLQPNWWYWSTPSTAAKINSLSALALRIYALDSAISYEKPLFNVGLETPEQNCASPSSPPLQKPPELDSVETPKTRSRSNKKRKE